MAACDTHLDQPEPPATSPSGQGVFVVYLRQLVVRAGEEASGVKNVQLISSVVVAREAR